MIQILYIRAAMIATVATAGALLASTAQAAGFPFRRVSPAAVSNFQLPALNTDTTADIGESVVAAGQAQPTYEVTEAMQINVGVLKPLAIPTGTYSIVASNDEGNFFQVRDIYATPKVRFSYGFFIPNDTSRPAEAYGENLFAVARQPMPDFKGKPGLPTRSPRGFRKELVYSGISKGVVTLTYRETIDGLARPAFTQTLTYDLAEGDVIGFGGARLKVIKATNVNMTYVLEKPFN